MWNFDLGLSYRAGSIATFSRPPATAYSFESLADRERSVSISGGGGGGYTRGYQGYEVNASSV